MKSACELLAAYEASVECPDVSGFEVIEMLNLRSKIAAAEPQLSQEHLRSLEAADRRLIQQAKRFCRSLSEIADISVLRSRAGVLPSHWWWYLDVIVEQPIVAA